MPDMTPAIRPAIVTATAAVSLGQQLAVETDMPCTFALIRLAAVTHTISNDARRIPLTDIVSMDDTTAGGVSYMLAVPSNANVVLPGSYWLFALDNQGTPSEGWNIDISL